MHPATVTISLIATESNPKSVKVSGFSLSDFGNIFRLFNVRYKSINAQYVAVNAKAFVRSKRYCVYEVNGNNVQSQQVKVYAVNARNLLVWNYVLPFRVVRHRRCARY